MPPIRLRLVMNRHRMWAYCSHALPALRTFAVCLCPCPIPPHCLHVGIHADTLRSTHMHGMSPHMLCMNACMHSVWWYSNGGAWQSDGGGRVIDYAWALTTTTTTTPICLFCYMFDARIGSMEPGFISARMSYCNTISFRRSLSYIYSSDVHCRFASLPFGYPFIWAFP